MTLRRPLGFDWEITGRITPKASRADNASFMH